MTRCDICQVLMSGKISTTRWYHDAYNLYNRNRIQSPWIFTCILFCFHLACAMPIHNLMLPRSRRAIHIASVIDTFRSGTGPTMPISRLGRVSDLHEALLKLYSDQ